MIEVNVVNLDVPERVMALIGPQAMRTVLLQVAEAARDKWIQLAAEQLHSSRKDYIDAIQSVELKGDLATVALVGDFPNQIEHGWEGGDMRDFLLSEQAPHQDTIHTNQQGGRYRHVPFRHQTPGTRGTAGAVMGSQYAPNRPGSLAAPHAVVEDFKEMGKRVHRAAKQLQPGEGLRELLAAFAEPDHQPGLHQGS